MAGHVQSFEVEACWAQCRKGNDSNLCTLRAKDLAAVMLSYTKDGGKGSYGQ